MKAEGPSLDPLLHRLTECPPEFLQVAAGFTLEAETSEGVDVVAIISDTMALVPDQPPELQAQSLAELRGRTQPQWRLFSVVCWLLHDEWFLSHRQPAAALWKLLTSGELTRLAALIRPETFVSDPDRREELVRTCLAQLGLRPHGETMSQATDRLTTLDTAERDRVLRATAVARRRAREIREAMARKQAQESASRYGE